MKQIRIALVLLAALASSNSQAAPAPNSQGSKGRQGSHRIFRSGRTPGKTGANAPKSIRATQHAAGPTSGSPGDQGASNPLLEKKNASSQ